MSAVYTFPDVAYGQTLEQRVFQFKRMQQNTLINLTGATVKMEIKSENGNRVYLTKDNDSVGGITINDPSTCTVTIEAIDVVLTPRRYIYDITVTYSDGVIKKFAIGYFNVVSLKKFADV